MVVKAIQPQVVNGVPVTPRPALWADVRDDTWNDWRWQ
jgi:hypothetical protein